MTKEQLVSLRDTITARLNEEPVQWRYKGNSHADWNDYPDPHSSIEFPNTNLEWRPKPKPPTWWLNIGYDGDAGKGYKTKEEALRQRSSSCARTIEVEEVIKPNQKDT